MMIFDLRSNGYIIIIGIFIILIGFIRISYSNEIQINKTERKACPYMAGMVAGIVIPGSNVCFIYQKCPPVPGSERSC